ncbi:MAG: pilus (MSHA type) biogenesis protein MshL [Gammaproteobacteria bacterium]|nr:MAG: pilus (MSHA type) biogenesis protein MshL [Gammaproteobacteria bacterium]
MKQIISKNPILAKALTIIAVMLLGLSCSKQNNIKPSQNHIGNQQKQPVKRSIPQPVKKTAFVPPPKPRKKLETYSVSVQNVPVKELLFALARDANLNIDFKGNIQGTTTLTAVNQTLPQILDRISDQNDLICSLKGNFLHISEDKPYLKHYLVEYPNVTRESESIIETSTGINNGVTQETSSQQGNTSTTSVTNRSSNMFWDSLTTNLNNIISHSETTASSGTQSTPATGNQPATNQGATNSGSTNTTAATSNSSSSNENNDNIIVNKETGVIYIRATQKQHAEVQRFLDQILASARRQVLIEATIAEVTLNEKHQIGIDWSSVADNLGRFSIATNLTGENFSSATSLVFPSRFSGAPAFNTGYTRSKDGRTNSILLKMLDQYGDVKVLSSPKIMALNNQTSLLKVVDNKVYFSVNIETETDADTGQTTSTYETTAHSVPIGFIMNVTPYVNSSNEIILNIRPTITRIIGYVEDPNPDLASANISNTVPEVQIREMESILRVNSGEIAVIGGLMQDSFNNSSDEVPLLGKIPYIGNAFKYQEKDRQKTELVIFLKPTLIKKADINGDLKQFRRFLHGNSNNQNKEEQR